MSCRTRSGASPSYASASCGRACIASARKSSTWSSSSVPQADGSSSGPGRVEFHGFTSAPVAATFSANSGGMAYVTRCPRATSSRITSRLGFTWPWAAMENMAMCERVVMTGRLGETRRLVQLVYHSCHQHRVQSQPLLGRHRPYEYGPVKTGGANRRAHPPPGVGPAQGRIQRPADSGEAELDQVPPAVQRRGPEQRCTPALDPEDPRVHPWRGPETVPTDPTHQPPFMTRPAQDRQLRPPPVVPGAFTGVLELGEECRLGECGGPKTPVDDVRGP